MLHNVMCFHRVMGYGIDGNNTVSNLAIEGKVHNLIDNTHQGEVFTISWMIRTTLLHSESVDTSSRIIAIVVPTVSLLLILIAITLFCSVLLLKKSIVITACYSKTHN